LYELTSRQFTVSDGTHRWAASDPEACPYLCLLDLVDAYCVMGGGRSLVVTFRALFIRAGSRIYDDTFAVKGQLITKNITMAVSWLVIWPKWATVED
jgi:hypothetical protein